MEPRHLILYLSLMNNGNWEEIYKMVKGKQRPNVTNDVIEETAAKYEGEYITLLDKDYPKVLQTCTDATVPFVLFYKGDISLLRKKTAKVAVIGSRNSSKYGESRVEKIVKDLPNEYVIISGLAKGIDTVAINAALDSGKKVIAVIGCAINDYYPLENKPVYERVVSSGGVIVSEYPPGTKIDPANFRWRNRIVANLSDVIFVGEAYQRSGCSITVGFGLNYGKTVCCLPYPSGVSSFNNELIKEGAALIEDASDIENLLN